MSDINTEYSLHRIKTDGLILSDALRVYVAVTNSSIRTSTNEITYWLQRYNEQYDDVFLIFAFCRNDKVIGFAQSVYFEAERVLVIDHIAIDSAYRGQNTFFEFIDQIKRYLDDKEFEINYTIAEIGHFSMEDEPHGDSRKLIKLLKFAGFMVAKAPYYQPQLGAHNAESVMRGTLMVLKTDPSDLIKKETFLMFINTIYYKHYLRWYTPFKQIDFHNYKKHLDELYIKIASQVSDPVILNGTTGFEGEAMRSKSSGSNVGRVFASLAYTLLFVAVFISIIVGALVLKTDISSISVALLMAIVCVLIVAGLAFDRPLLLLDKIAAWAKYLSGKK